VVIYVSPTGEIITTVPPDLEQKLAAFRRPAY
jgi:hypothetical protein